MRVCLIHTITQVAVILGWILPQSFISSWSLLGLFAFSKCILANVLTTTLWHCCLLLHKLSKCYCTVSVQRGRLYYRCYYLLSRQLCKTKSKLYWTIWFHQIKSQHTHTHTHTKQSKAQQKVKTNEGLSMAQRNDTWDKEHKERNTDITEQANMNRWIQIR